MAYEKILVAVDLGGSSGHLLATAQKLMANPEAELHVLHAVEPLNVTYGADIP
ncbi:MAG: universal stress protein, partial [Luminiphilus sp.]